MNLDPYRRNPARDNEAFAARLVAAWLGNRGHLTNTGAGHGPDFRIDYVDGRVGLGEVVLHEDGVVQAMWSETFRKERHQQIDLPDGRGQWSVGLVRGANIKRLYKQLPDFIATIASMGLERFTVYDFWPRGEPADTARELGLNYLSRVDKSDPSVAVFFMPGGGGTIPTDPDVIVDWLDSVVADPAYEDLTRKLLELQADERHIFITASSATPFGADERLRRLGQAIPQRSPRIPAGITHVWAASRWGDGPIGVWTNGTWRIVPMPSLEGDD